MIHARIEFDATIGLPGSADKITHTVSVGIEVEAIDQPMTVDQMKQMLVQVAIALTSEEYHDALARDLARPEPPRAAPHAQQLQFPKADTRGLKRIK